MPTAELALLIRSALKQAGYKTNYAAAKAIGIDPRTLDRLQKGEVSPSIETLERIFHPIGWEVAVSFFPRKP